MADEAQIRVSMSIRAGNIDHQTRPTAFTVDVDGRFGPAPGTIAIAVADTGQEIDLSMFTTPGLCAIQNLDAVNYVEVGIYEPATSTFYPLLEIGPGEIYIMKLTRNLLEEYVGTGTSAPTNQLRARATGGTCNVTFSIFER